MKTFERLLWTPLCALAAWALIYVGSKSIGRVWAMLPRENLVGLILVVVSIVGVFAIWGFAGIHGFNFLHGLWTEAEQPQRAKPKAPIPEVPSASSTNISPKARVNDSTLPILPQGSHRDGKIIQADFGNYRMLISEGSIIEPSKPHDPQPPLPKAIEQATIPSYDRTNFSGNFHETKTIRGRVVLSPTEELAQTSKAITVYAFGQNEFKELQPRVRQAIRPTLSYYSQEFSIALSQGNEDVAAHWEKMSADLLTSEYDYLPAGSLFAKTNAEGRFFLLYRFSAPYVLVAKASRETGGKVIHYEWVLSSDMIREGEEVLLSASNTSRQTSLPP